MVTEEGVLMDPLADKLMSVGAIIAFTVIRDTDGSVVVPVAILIIILIKEALMIGGGIFLYYKNIVTPSNMFGKIAAFTFNTAVAFTFLYKIVSPWHIYFLWFALVLMVAALLQYAYFNMFKKLKKDSRVKS
jgi:cardiolipin synthase